jgi:hypothetical protein
LKSASRRSRNDVVPSSRSAVWPSS